MSILNVMLCFILLVIIFAFISVLAVGSILINVSDIKKEYKK